MKIIPSIRRSIVENKFILFSVGVLVFANLLFNFFKSSPIPQEQLQADTVIPKGFVLVPIQLVNIEAISAVIKDYGVIDLYYVAFEKKIGQKILSRIKLIRAPLNHNEFAVLVTENESEKLMKYGGPFLGAIQNRNVKQVAAQAEPLRNNNTLKIEYGQEL